MRPIIPWLVVPTVYAHHTRHELARMTACHLSVAACALVARFLMFCALSQEPQKSQRLDRLTTRLQHVESLYHDMQLENCVLRAELRRAGVDLTELLACGVMSSSSLDANTDCGDHCDISHTMSPFLLSGQRHSSPDERRFSEKPEDVITSKPEDVITSKPEDVITSKHMNCCCSPDTLLIKKESDIALV